MRRACASRAGISSLLRNIRETAPPCAAGGVGGRAAARLRGDDLVVAVASFTGAGHGPTEGIAIGGMHGSRNWRRAASFGESSGREVTSTPPNRPPFTAKMSLSAALGSNPLVMRLSAARARGHPSDMRYMSAAAGPGACKSPLNVAEGAAGDSPPAADASGDGNEQSLDSCLDPSLLSEAASSTLWTRFYSGDPEFWVNIYYAQELLANVQAATGLPWWASIMCVTVGTRVLLFPAFVYQQRVVGRLQAAVPELQAVEMEHHTAREIYKDPAAAARRSKKMREIYKKHACHPWRLGANMLAIGPAFMSFFFGIKQMSSTYPSVSTGGMWWFRDLAAPDPYCVLPIVASFSFLGIMEFALRGRAASMQPMQYKMQLGVQRIVCLSMAPLLIGLHYPAGVFVYWITNNTISMAQVLAFNHPPVRAAFGLTPIPTAPTQGSAEEFENIRQKILSVSRSPALNVPGEGEKTRSD